MMALVPLLITSSPTVSHLLSRAEQLAPPATPPTTTTLFKLDLPLSTVAMLLTRTKLRERGDRERIGRTPRAVRRHNVKDACITRIWPSRLIRKLWQTQVNTSTESVG